MIVVPIKINKLKIDVTCRVADKEDPFYDILINLNIQDDYRLFIYPVLYSLFRIKDNNIIDYQFFFIIILLLLIIKTMIKKFELLNVVMMKIQEKY